MDRFGDALISADDAYPLMASLAARDAIVDSAVAPGRRTARLSAVCFDAPRLLVVGTCDVPDWPTMTRASDWHSAAAAIKADALSGDTIDLMLVAPHLADGTDAWSFIAAVRGARPWQAWALIATRSTLTPALESRARQLGAAGVFDPTTQFDELLDLASRLRAARTAADAAEHEADAGRRPRRPARHSIAPAALQPDFGAGANPALAG